MDANQKCAACDKVKQEAEPEFNLKWKRDLDGFNAVCNQLESSESRKAVRDMKKAELEGDSGK